MIRRFYYSVKRFFCKHSYLTANPGTTGIFYLMVCKHCGKQMQEKNDAAVLAEQEENEKKAVLEETEKGFFQPNKERNHRGIYFPEYWRKKRLKCSFVSQLEETAKKTATLKDKHGEYKDGLFLYGCLLS